LDRDTRTLSGGPLSYAALGSNNGLERRLGDGCTAHWHYDPRDWLRLWCLVVVTA